MRFDTSLRVRIAWKAGDTTAFEVAKVGGDDREEKPISVFAETTVGEIVERLQAIDRVSKRQG
jgi:hypothetical protein